MPLSLHVNTADSLEDRFVLTRVEDKLLVVSNKFNMTNHCDAFYSIFTFSKVFPVNPIKAYMECRSTGLFISPSGISELDCATTKTDTVERSISIGRESLQVFFLY